MRHEKLSKKKYLECRQHGLDEIAKAEKQIVWLKRKISTYAAKGKRGSGSDSKFADWRRAIKTQKAIIKRYSEGLERLKNHKRFWQKW
jgi:hypothetical protein